MRLAIYVNGFATHECCTSGHSADIKDCPAELDGVSPVIPASGIYRIASAGVASD